MVNLMAIRIVTDSCSDLPPEAARASGITVVPLYVTIGGETYRDGVDIDADRFYSLLEELPSLPTTSQPTVADFQEVYQGLLDQGHQVVSIHVGAKLSGTLNSAVQAKASLGDPPQIEIVDSQLASGAQWARGRPTTVRWPSVCVGRLGGTTALSWSTPWSICKRADAAARRRRSSAGRSVSSPS